MSSLVFPFDTEVTLPLTFNPDLKLMPDIEYPNRWFDMVPTKYLLWDKVHHRPVSVSLPEPSPETVTTITTQSNETEPQLSHLTMQAKSNDCSLRLNIGRRYPASEPNRNLADVIVTIVKIKPGPVPLYSGWVTTANRDSFGSLRLASKKELVGAMQGCTGKVKWMIPFGDKLVEELRKTNDQPTVLPIIPDTPSTYWVFSSDGLKAWEYRQGYSAYHSTGREVLFDSEHRLIDDGHRRITYGTCNRPLTYAVRSVTNDVDDVYYDCRYETPGSWQVTVSQNCHPTQFFDFFSKTAGIEILFDKADRTVSGNQIRYICHEQLGSGKLAIRFMINWTHWIHPVTGRTHLVIEQFFPSAEPDTVCEQYLELSGSNLKSLRPEKAHVVWTAGEKITWKWDYRPVSEADLRLYDALMENPDFTNPGPDKACFGRSGGWLD